MENYSVRPALLLITALAMLSAWTCVAAEPSATSTPKTSRPNVVLILADDLGYGDTGCYGATKIKTPHLDRLATEGLRFTDAHSASAVCSPSRYALLSGEYPFRANMWGPLAAASKLRVDTRRATLASLFKSAGYATACIGKWHLGFGDQDQPDWNKDLKPGPLECGFDYYYGLPIVSSFAPYVYVENHRVVGLDPNDPLKYGGTVEGTMKWPEKGLNGMSGGKAAHELYREDQLATVLTDKATTWLKSNKEKPFFLYYATPHIHHPFTASEKFRGTSECGRYGDFVQEFDDMVGQVMRTLDDLGVADNTLIIVTSDNGGMLNQGGQDAWKAGHRINGDLLGFKFDAWEGGHRVPFLARWPGRIKPGSVSNQLLALIDLPASFGSMLGAKLNPGDFPDSVNALAVLDGSATQPIRDRLIISPFHATHLTLREGKWLYIGVRGGGGFTSTKPGDHALGGPAALKFAGETNSDIANGKFKDDAPQAQLYDLQADPSQTTNVIRHHPEVATKMAATLKELVGNEEQRGKAAPGSKTVKQQQR